MSSVLKAEICALVRAATLRALIAATWPVEKDAMESVDSAAACVAVSTPTCAVVSAAA